MADFRIIENSKYKMLSSKDANYFFNKETGFMSMWGKTHEEDAVKFPAPTLLDMEVTTICKGVDGKPCRFCYKNGSPNGKYMTFGTFKTIFDKMPKSLTQIAFGADAQAESNPDLIDMMKYAREHGVIPNITVAQLSEEMAEKLSKVCGAVAVSRYAHNPDACYDSVYKLTKRGMRQVNIHMMIAEETYQDALQLIDDCATDDRLKGLNAVVFLSLKRKGRGAGFTPMTQEHFNDVVQKAMRNDIRIGFDSCSSFKSLRAFEEVGKLQFVKDSVIACESTLESSYINVDGMFFPCSFLEGEKGWEEGLDVVNCTDFIKDIWDNPKTEEFRNSLLASTASVEDVKCRVCPYFEV